MKAMLSTQDGSNFLTDPFYAADIKLAARQARCGHTQERYVCVDYGVVDISRRMQPATTYPVRNQFLQLCLSKRSVAGFQRFYLHGVAVDADYHLSVLRHTSGGHRTDIPEAKNTYAL